MDISIKGLIVPLVTPFDGYDVDYHSLKKLMEFCKENGADGFVALGTTAEAPTLTDYERDCIINFCLNNSDGLPVIAGTGSNCTKKAVELTLRAEELGANGVLSVCPYYNKPPKTGIIEHFKAIAGATRLPVILYNVPSRTGVDMPLDVIEDLSTLPNIIGIKEAGDSTDKLAAIKRNCINGFALYGGNDLLTCETLEAGGLGLISAAANVLPRSFTDIITAYSNGNKTTGREIFNSILPTVKGLYVETNPVAVKYALSRMGLVKNCLRLPMCPISHKNAQALDKIMEGNYD